MAPTLEELIALPYGDGEGAQPLILTQLLALPYNGGSDYEKGLVTSDFRREMRLNGERVQWLKPYASDTTVQGLAWIPQPLPDDARVFIYQNQRTIQSEEFGEIAVGETMLSWMPDELSPKRNDRFVALDRPGQPAYELLFERVKQAPLGQDEKRLPASAPLRLLGAGE